MTQTADVLVIGGGIAGIGAAALIALDARVIVLEREEVIGYHSTGRSAAIFLHNYGNSTIRALTAASFETLAEPDGISDNPLLSPRGEMLIADDEDVPALEAYLADAVGMEELSPTEACQLVPILRRERIARAAIESDAQDIDVDRLMQGWARMLRARGGRIEPNADVLEIACSGGVWRLRTLKEGYEAPIVVNAAGAWADAVARRADISPVGLQALRRSAAVLPAPTEHAIIDWPLVASAAETWYAKPAAGKLIVSPADEDPVDPHDAWPDDMVLAEGLHRFEQATTIEVKRLEHSWAGLRSFVSDRTPVVGFATDAEGYFWLAGQGGYGVQTAPALSRLAADLVCARTPILPDDVLLALSPARLRADRDDARPLIV